MICTVGWDELSSAKYLEPAPLPGTMCAGPSLETFPHVALDMYFTVQAWHWQPSKIPVTYYGNGESNYAR